MVKAVDVFRSIESLPFTRESSDLFDRPSISLGKILGGDAVNRVPDACTIDLDIRYLPGQDPEEILAAVAEQRDTEVTKVFHREPIVVSRDEPYVQVLAEAVSKVSPVKASIAVGRDGTSDVISFLERRHPGRGVRPDRRRPPRARRVGLDRVARPVPPGAGGVREPDPGSAPRRART